MPPKMHVDEVSTDVALVRRLLRAQAGEWAELDRFIPVETYNAYNAVPDEQVPAGGAG